MNDTVEPGVHELDKESFFRRAGEAYRTLKADRKACEEELRERTEWDCALLDGLELDEVWSDDGSARIRSQGEDL
jgi:hypothetical protein